MKSPLLLSVDLEGTKDIHLRIEPQGNLIHRGGDYLCWCCPALSVERTRDGLVSKVFTHRRIGLN